MIVSGVVFLISLLSRIAFVVLKSKSIYFYTDKVFHETQQNFLIILLIVSGCAILFTLIAGKPLKIILVSLCLSTLLVNCAFTGGFWDSDKVYFTFTSPDNKYILIVEECSWLLGSWSNCYIKIHSNFVKDLNAYISTDGYRPFSRNDYKIKWGNNSIIITYGFREKDIHETITLTLE